MKRIPEPRELMDEPAQARAYAEADFSEPNNLFVELFADLCDDRFSGHTLDLGCGPGDIPLQLLERFPDARVTAVDGADAMLALGRAKLGTQTALVGRITWICCHLPTSTLPANHYDAIVSNSLLHHMADPQSLWQSVTGYAKPGANILVMDLARPDSETAVGVLVQTHASDAPNVLREDFRNSLFAAYTPDEVAGQLGIAGLQGLNVSMVSDRHLAVRGRLQS